MTVRRRVVVVGAGSAGCVVADRVGRSGVDDVLVLEAGGAAPPVDLAVLPLADPSRVRVHHDRDGTALPRGAGLGGSSAVNGGYFLRAHATDLAGWARSTWDPQLVEDVYTSLDGGDAGGGAMAVRRVPDAELRPRARAFEAAMRRAGHEHVAGVWPTAGIVRVRLNATGSRRRTAADALLSAAVARPNVTLRVRSPVERIEIDSETVRSVILVDGTAIPADVVVLCAGTIGSATVAARSGVATTMPLAEHREVLVRSRGVSSGPGQVGPVLQSVVHTDDGFEIRCYERDFADHVDGVPRSGPAIGVAAMRPVGPGSITIAPDGTSDIDLGRPDAAGTARMRALADEVAAMLDGPDFAGLVVPGSTTVDDTLSTSHHAWGALPLGSAADWDGRVRGVDGLWVADAAALPTPLSSGPHATVMMAASVIGEQVAAAGLS
ncbi:MAG: mycofactocin system GMC family oxidoreductase MftG [Williamsia herbipolensis]|nr:mycofactocin system GMC family oxidoreductase MftG [Williamsia herbipolensis]